jgi:hypothetical protein
MISDASAKKILFAAHDPGGANIILPIIEFLADLDEFILYLVMLGPADTHIHPQRPNIMEISVTGSNVVDFPNEKSTSDLEIEKLFSAYQFDLVFTATSCHSNLERLIIREGLRRNIPVVSIIDCWSNYHARFLYRETYAYPDILFVCDQTMKQAIAQQFIPSKIIVSGNPHLEILLKKYPDVKRIDRNQTKRIRFFSDNNRLYYPDKTIDEFVIVDSLICFLSERVQNVDLLVRPHPMESIEPWHNHFEYLKRKYDENNVTLAIDDVPIGQVLEDSFIAVGLSSMVLVETAVCGIPTFSYQIDMAYENYFYLPFETYGIKRLRCHEDLNDLFSGMETNPMRFSLQEKSSLRIIHDQIMSILP